MHGQPGLERAQAKDTFQLRMLDGRKGSARASGNDQLVITYRELSPFVAISHGDTARLGINLRHFAVYAHIHALLAHLLRCAHNEITVVADITSE